MPHWPRVSHSSFRRLLALAFAFALTFACARAQDDEPPPDDGGGPGGITQKNYFTDAINATGGLSLSTWIRAHLSSYMTLPIVVAGPISGTGNVTADYANSGGLTTFLGGNNTFVGNVIITQHLAVNGDAAFGDSSNVVQLAGGTFRHQPGAYSLPNGSTFVSFSVPTNLTIAHALEVTSAGGTFDIQSGSVTWSGARSGMGDWSKTGAGTLILSGSNSGSGNVSISGGTLQISADAQLGTGALTIDGGSIQFGAAFNDLRAFTLGAAGATLDTNGFDVSYQHAISGARSLTKSGSGTLTLTGNLDYTGNTNVTAGTLSATNGFSSSSAHVLSGTGALALSADSTVASLSGAGGGVNLGSHTLTLGGDNASTTFSGAISGLGGLVKTGTGVFTLSGANTFEGPLTVLGGTVMAASDSALGSSSSGNVILNGGSLRLSDGVSITRPIAFMVGSSLDVATGAATLGGVISGAQRLTKTGAGTLTLSGANTYSGGTTVSAGVLQIDTDSRLGSAGELTLDGGTLRFGAAFNDLRATTLGASGGGFDTNGYNATISSLVSGGGGLAKTGSGTLTLSGANTYAGGTTVAAGTLALGHADGVAASGTVTVNSGATFDTGSFGFDLSRVAGTGSLTGSGTFAYNSASDRTLTTTISGSASLTKSGTGTLTLAAAAAHTGRTVVSAGTLRLGGANLLSTGSQISVFTGGTLDLAGHDQTIRELDSSNGSPSGTVENGTVVLGGATLTTVNSGLALWGGSIQGNGNVTLTGSGEARWSGSNVFTGTLTLSGGTLRAAAANTLSPNATASIASGATLDLSNFSQTTAGLAGAGSITLGSATLTVNQSTDTTFSGAISGSGGLVKSGAGALALTGVNDYTGGTSVTGGFLAISADNRLGPGTLTLDGGGIRYGAAFDDLRAFTLGSGGATLDTNGFTVGYAHAISGSGGFTKTGAGILTLTGVNTFTGGTSVTGGLLQIDADSRLSTGTLTLNGGGIRFGSAFSDLRAFTAGSAGATLDTNSYDITYGGAISGTGGFTKTGAGTLTLTGDNTYAGTTTVSTGTLQIGAGGTTGSLGNAGSAIAVDGTLVFKKSDTVMLGGVISGSGSLTQQGTGTLVFAADNTYSGGTLVANGTLQVGNGGTTGALGSGDVTNNGTLVFNRSNDATFTNVISGAGAVVQKGGGVVDLLGANTFSGGLRIESGFVRVGADANLGATGGGITLAGGRLSTMNSFTSARPITLEGGVNNVLWTWPGTTLTWTGTIAGTGTLGKGETGTLVLSGANTYTGGTLIFAGTLTLGDASGVGPSGTINIASGATFNTAGFGFDVSRLAGTGTATGSGVFSYNSASNATLTTSLAGGAALSKSGTGTLSVTGANVLTGGTGIFGGTLQVGDGGTSGSLNGVISISTGATLAYNRSDDFTSAASVSGSGGVTKYGGNTLTLTGANTFTGELRILGGTLMPGAGSFPDGVNSVFVDAGARLMGGGLAVASLSGSGTVQMDDAAFRVTNSGSFSGTLTGTAGLQKSGSGTLTLSGDNTYAGGTTIFSGTLALGHANGAGSSGIVTVASGAVFNTAGYGFDLARLSGSGTATGSGTFTYAANGDQTVATALAGTASVVKSGSGNLTLTGANTFTGELRILGGTLTPGPVSFPTGVSSVFIDAGATLIGGSLAVGSLTGTGTVRSDGLPFWITDSGSFAGSLTGTSELRKSGTGTLTLSGNNTYTGGTTILSGTLALANGANGVGTSGTVTVQSGATFDIGSSTFDISRLVGNATATNAGTFSYSSASDFTLSGILSGNAGLTKSGAGTLTLAATPTLTGPTHVTGGFLQVSSNARLGSGAVILNGGGIRYGAAFDDLRAFTLRAGGGTLDTNGFNVTHTASISGAGVFTKAGPGTLTLAASNTYTGGTTIAAGTLKLGDGANGVGTSGTVTVNSGATFDVGSSTFDISRLVGNATSTGGGTFSYSSAGDFTLSGVLSGNAGLIKSGAGTLTLGGANTYSGDTLVNAGTLRLGAANALSPSSKLYVAPGAAFDLNGFAPVFADLSGSGDLNVGSGGLNVALSGTSSFSGTLSGTGGFTMSGSGTLTLGAANTYSGATTISGGTVKLGAAGALPNGTPVSLASGATLDLNGNAATLGSLGGAGNVALGGANLVIAQNANTTFAGVLSGTGGLTKSGSGRLTLTGTHTFSGATSVTGGEIKLNGSAANSAFTLSGGAMLSGNGTVGALTIGSGGILSPGNSPGTTNAGNTTWTGGGSFLWELNKTAGTAGSDPGWDLLSISGALNIGATSSSKFTLSLTSLTLGNAAGQVSDFNASSNYSFTFVTTTGGITGFDASAFTLDTSGFQNPFTGTWSIAQSGNNLTLNYASMSAIPEPSTYAAIAGAGVLSLAVWRRRKQTAEQASLFAE